MKTADVETLFKRAFGHAPPRVIRVPATLEVLGGYTEAHSGIGYSAAVDRFVEFAFVPRTDGRIELVHGDDAHRARFWVSDCRPGQGPNWSAPVMAVMAHLRALGVAASGFRAAIVNRIPSGIGLGEMAAETLAAALAIRQMFPFRVTESGLVEPPRRDNQGNLPPIPGNERFRFARLCHEAERRFFAGQEFLHPMLTPLFARGFHLTQTDYLHAKVENHSLIGEVVFVICDTGVRDPHVGLRTSQFQLVARGAAEKIGLKALRSLDAGLLNGSRTRLDAREFGVAKFVMGECQLAVGTEKSLAGGELLQFGNYLTQSHETAGQHGGITCPELDVLVKLASRHPACIGSRFIGPGFGGATLNLVAWPQMDSFVEVMKSGYRDATGKDLHWFRAKSVDGVFA